MLGKTYFMHRAKRKDGTWDKGIEIKESLDAAKQSLHAYLGAYAYGKEQGTDYVCCSITDYGGNQIGAAEVWWSDAARDEIIHDNTEEEEPTETEGGIENT